MSTRQSSPTNQTTMHTRSKIILHRIRIRSIDHIMSELRRGDLLAEWEYIGAGLSGDYDPDDPDDIELLRFSVSKFGEQLDDASYCTLMPVGTDPKILERALNLILDAVDTDASYKKEL